MKEVAPRLAALVASRQTRPIDPAVTAATTRDSSPLPMSCKLPCGATSEQRKRLLIGPVWPAAVRRGLSWPFHGSPLGGARGRRPVMRRPPHLAGRGGHSWAIRGEIMRSFSPPSSPLRRASTTVLLRGVGAYHRTFYFINFLLYFYFPCSSSGRRRRPSPSPA